MSRLKRSLQQKNDHSQKYLDDLLRKYGLFDELAPKRRQYFMTETPSTYTVSCKIFYRSYGWHKAICERCQSSLVDRPQDDMKER